MLEGLPRRDSLRVVNLQHLRQEVKASLINEVFVLTGYIFLPLFLAEVYQVLLEEARQADVVELRNVLFYILSAYYSCYLQQLIIIVRSLEKWFLHEHHARQHAACRPYIKLIVVVVISKEELGCFKISRSHPTVESLTWMVKVCKTPIYNFERSVFTVHEDIARLDVAMDDAP